MKDNFDLYFREAETLYSQGEYKEALDIFKKLEQIKNDNDLSNYIGCCFLNLGDYIEAERAFKALTDKASEWERPWFNLARVYLATKRLEEAYKCFEIALKINPLSADANFYMGLYYEKTNDIKQAIDFYNKSIELEDSMECHLNLSRCYYSLKEIDSAITHAISAYNADKSDNDAVYNLSLILIKQKRYIEVYQILCCDTFKNSYDLGVLKNLLFSSIKVTDFETAKSVAERLIFLDPSNRLANDFLINSKGEKQTCGT